MPKPKLSKAQRNYRNRGSAPTSKTKMMSVRVNDHIAEKVKAKGGLTKIVAEAVK